MGACRGSWLSQTRILDPKEERPLIPGMTGDGRWKMEDGRGAEDGHSEKLKS